MPEPSPMEFPFRTRLSLAGLIDFWERQNADEGSLYSSVARVILEKLQEAPELRRAIDDPSMLDGHRELVDLMMTAMVPPARLDDYYAMAVEPFGDVPFYESPAWKRLGFDHIERFKERINIPSDQMALGKLMWAYEVLLVSWLGVEADLDYALVLSVHDSETGLDRHFSLKVDPRFASVRPIRDITKPSAEDIARLLAEPTDLELWTELLPPDAFEFEGLTVLTAADVTLH